MNKNIDLLQFKIINDIASSSSKNNFFKNIFYRLVRFKAEKRKEKFI